MASSEGMSPLRLPVSNSCPSLGTIDRPATQPGSPNVTMLPGERTSLGRSPGSIASRNKMSPGRFKEFLSRQGARSFEIRKEASNWHREFRSRAIEEDNRWCPQGADGLRRSLLRQYCSIPEAWRHAIDKHKAGKIGFMELSRACREIGFGGNYKKLWSELDSDRDGSISLLDLDLEGRDAVAEFINFLTAKFGSTIQAWKEGLDINGALKLEEKEFIDRCTALGYSGDASKLFIWLQTKPARFITFRDIDPATAKNGGQDVVYSPKHGVSEKIKIIDERDCGVKTAAGLRTMLFQRYGSLLTAWRQALDPHGSDKLTLFELSIALRNIGFSGSMKQVMSELDPDNTGFVTFKEFDPKLHAINVEYKQLVKDKFGNLLTAWFTDLDKSNQGCVDDSTFIEHCGNVGFAGDARQLFRSLQSNRASNFLYLRDWDTRAHRAFARGDMDMISEMSHAEDKIVAGQNFHERQEVGFRHRWTQSQVRKERADFAATKKELLEADCGANGGYDSLKKLLIKNYGTLPAAWRQGLDPEGLGQLPFKEFATVVRNVGFSGNIRQVWEEVGGQNLHTGYVTLANLDPEAGPALATFRAELVAKFGDIITAWNEGLDKSRNGQLEEDKFIKKFQELGLEGDAEFIFANLRVRGRNFIMLNDVEPKALQAWYRGDDKAVTLKPPRGDPAAKSRPGSSAGRRPKSPKSRSSTGASSVLVLPEVGGQTEQNASPSGRTSEREGAATGATATTRLSHWSRELGLRMRYETQRQYQEERDKCMGCNTLQGLKQHLVDKYGSLTSGWRHVLDTAGNGRLSFLEFGQSLRELPFQGSAKELFSELGGDQRGYITLDALDPETARTLSALRELLLLRYNSLLDAWNQYIDDAGNIWLDEEEFLLKISGIGFDYGGAKKGHSLFRSFMPDIYSQHLHVDDLKVMLIGVSKSERKRAWAGLPLPPPPVRTTRPNSANTITGATSVRSSRPDSPLFAARKQSPKSRAKGASRPTSAAGDETTRNSL